MQEIDEDLKFLEAVKDGKTEEEIKEIFGADRYAELVSSHVNKDITIEDGKLVLNEESEEETFENKIVRAMNDSTRNRTCYSSGMIENIFYHTIFINQGGKYRPVVVTSNGKVLEVINKEKELIEADIKKKEIEDDDRYFYFNYNGVSYKFFTELFFRDTLLIFSVHNHILEPILKKRIPNKKLYDELKKLVWDYYDHNNDFEYDVVNAFVVHSYILRALGRAFYYVLQGKEDTGKSTLQKIFAMLQFNGLFGGKGTIAVNARLIHCLGVNLNQDEFDKLAKEEKRDFTGMLNSGLYKDGTYSFVNINKQKIKDQITALFTFSAKSFSANNLFGFDKSFLSRCYISMCVRKNRKTMDINDISEKELERFQDFRNKLFVYTLFNWKEIKKSIEEVKKELEDEGVFGRRTDMNSIILGIVKHFKGEYYKKVKEHLRDKEGVEDKEKSLTKDSIVLEYLVKQFLKEEPTVEVSNKDILKYLIEELGIDKDSDKKPTAQGIGWVLKKYNLLPRPGNLKYGARGNRKYIIERNLLIDILRRYQYNDLLEKIIDEKPPQNAQKPQNAQLETEDTEDTEVSEASSQLLKKYLKNPKTEEKLSEEDKQFLKETYPTPTEDDLLKEIPDDCETPVGLVFDAWYTKYNFDEFRCQEALDKLNRNGLVYFPLPGKVKKL